jgi:hypothetical protein
MYLISHDLHDFKTTVPKKLFIPKKKKTVKRDVHLNETKSFEKFGVVLRLITSGHL